MVKTGWLSAAMAVFAVAWLAGCGGDGGGAEVGEETTEQAAASGVNLTNEGVSLTSSCDFYGCSVMFHNTICNRGSSTVYGSVVGGRWNSSGTIHADCSGWWNALDTFGTISAGSCKDVTVAGPGYVGPKVNHGTRLSYTGMVDMYCSTAETSESDNTLFGVLPVP
jgi:hypothetical protein